MKKRTDEKVIYPELSYKVVGILYDVFNKIGPGHKEKYYQNAIAVAFKEHHLKFEEQVFSPLEYNSKQIGKYFLDFLIEDKIILEIKKDTIFRRPNIEQIFAYLRSKKMKLGILANFTRDGIKYKRIVNII